MKEAYCLLTLHLTIPHPIPSFIGHRNDCDNDDDSATKGFIDAIHLDWKSRIAGLGTNSTSWLCSEGLAEARRTMEASVANPFPDLFRLMRRRQRGCTARAARDAAKAYVQVAFAEMGPPALLKALSSQADDMVPTGQNQGVGLGSGLGLGSGSGGSEDGPDRHHSMPEVSEPQEHNVVEDDHLGPAILGGSEDGLDHHHSMPEVSEPREHNVVEDDHLGPD